MKRIALASVLTLFALTIASQRTTQALNDGSSANGSFQFVLEDNTTRYVEFNARMHGNNARGTMTFSDPTLVITDPESTTTTTGGFVTADFDCLRIEENRAVMGGVISRSNIATIIGRRVLLVVEDNGEGVNVSSPDRLTWGIYESPATGWTPVDAERDDDNGATLTWIATDAERPDDPGIPSNRSQIVRCGSFSMSSYSFVDVPHGSGNLQVKP